jgi:hypothetical protein
VEYFKHDLGGSTKIYKQNHLQNVFANKCTIIGEDTKIIQSGFKASYNDDENILRNNLQ